MRGIPQEQRHHRIIKNCHYGYFPFLLHLSHRAFPISGTAWKCPTPRYLSASCKGGFPESGRSRIPSDRRTGISRERLPGSRPNPGHCPERQNRSMCQLPEQLWSQPVVSRQLRQSHRGFHKGRRHCRRSSRQAASVLCHLYQQHRLVPLGPVRLSQSHRLYFTSPGYYCRHIRHKASELCIMSQQPWELLPGNGRFRKSDRVLYGCRCHSSRDPR